MRSERKTRLTIDELFSLRLFIGGLDGYPGARDDHAAILTDINAMHSRFTETPALATPTDAKHIRKLWAWAKRLDDAYRQAGLLYWKAGTSNAT